MSMSNANRENGRMKRLTSGILIGLVWAGMVACAGAEDGQKIRLLIDSDANNETDDQQDIFDKMPGKGPKVDLRIEGRHGGTFTTFGDYSVGLYRHAPQHGDPPFRSIFDATAVAILKDPGFGKAVEIPRPALHGQGWVDRPKNPVKMVLWEGFDSAAIMQDFYKVIDAATPD